MAVLNLGILAFAIYAAARGVQWAIRREYPAAWCWFALALLGLPALLMMPGVEP